MITYTYKHTQQKQRLENLFQQELLPVFESNAIEHVQVDFQLVIDHNGRTKESASIYLRYNNRLISFKAIKGRFKKSASIIIEDVKSYFDQTDRFLSA
ncbi:MULTISPECIES: hypothetical protein [Nonlabens]|uniref:Uncharacterized protein n=2 Tax=Nonlabens ulvanivorans TaxID=906888 RepID=A0A081DF87_NONUL|nr:hypothetical protein [Nonlabens ulvanivorans]GAK77583.1 hypothetical protein JCM19296_3191 [Nonlabens ulvanivorans]GAL75724.1 hypothetical protein JCM19275_1607 [Nonlabens ulvanivorans]